MLRLRPALRTVACAAAAAGLSLLCVVSVHALDRERGFCRGWERLSGPARYQQLRNADRSRAEAGSEAQRCLDAVRPRLVRVLDYECANWSALMNFEVEHLIHGVQDRCLEPQP